MSTDLVTSPAAARTYSVPAAVVASIGIAMSDQELADHHDNDLADRLVSGRAVFEDVVRVHGAAQDDGYRLRGGEAGQDWASKIVDGIMRELDRTQTDALSRYEYDPETYAYAGITATENEDLITQVIRFPREDSTLGRSEALTAGGWKQAVFDFTGEDRYTYGVGLDAAMLAFTASALIDEHLSGVLLNYGEPQCFLEAEPILASGIAPAPEAGGHVYAIVDANDTTAVMDLIMITPGPQVFRRNGGTWQLDKALLDGFMSPNPPPIVELTGATQKQIIAQVDANSANQVVTEGESSDAALGEGSMEVETKPVLKNPGVKKQEAKVDTAAPKPKPGEAPGKPAPPENREKRTPEDSEEGPNSRPPVTAALRASYEKELAVVAKLRARDEAKAAEWYYSDEGYAEGYSLTAALAVAEHKAVDRERIVRRMGMAAVATELRAQRARLAELEQVVLPALTAAARTSTAQPGVHTSPGQRKAENLRKYWVRGEGAVKIRWGATGDWTRCYRQLRPYIGERAKGWCALRHKEMTGNWTGSRANV